jgi:hypothetical protein
MEIAQHNLQNFKTKLFMKKSLHRVISWQCISSVNLTWEFCMMDYVYIAIIR